jgi:SAM-dependent methyltransferase
MDDKKKHWETIYQTKSEDQLSWSQAHPSPSIDWILEMVPDRSAGILDIGGGTSFLIDHLLDGGYLNPAVLDISSSALEQARARLGKRRGLVEWIEADISEYDPARKFSLWHDRAVFHFLTNRGARERYVTALKTALVPDGKVIVATFSPQGPGKCSGLDVMRFDPAALASELGDDFKALRNLRQIHKTPWGAEQDFLYVLFQRVR